MKLRSLFLFTLAGIGLAVTLHSCLRDDCSSTRTFIRFDPVYKTAAECRVGISVQAPTELRNPGKLYLAGQYLFINEKNEGIHVIDNADPANPKQIAFWSIPGNVDIAIRGQYLYADQYIDLLTIDISDMQNPQLVCRTEEAFQLFGFDPQLGYLINYEQTEVTQTITCDDNRWGGPFFFENGGVFITADVATPNSGNNNSNPLAAAGIGGSFARFHHC
jgi:hypothetical protein